MNLLVICLEYIIFVYLELEILEYVIVVLFIILLGLIGNIIVIFKILCDLVFYKIFYIVFLILVFFDLICLMLYIV